MEKDDLERAARNIAAAAASWAFLHLTQVYGVPEDLARKAATAAGDAAGNAMNLTIREGS